MGIQMNEVEQLIVVAATASAYTAWQQTMLSLGLPAEEWQAIEDKPMVGKAVFSMVALVLNNAQSHVDAIKLFAARPDLAAAWPEFGTAPGGVEAFVHGAQNVATDMVGFIEIGRQIHEAQEAE